MSIQCAVRRQSLVVGALALFVLSAAQGNPTGQAAVLRECERVSSALKVPFDSGRAIATHLRHPTEPGQMYWSVYQDETIFLVGDDGRLRSYSDAKLDSNQSSQKLPSSGGLSEVTLRKLCSDALSRLGIRSYVDVSDSDKADSRLAKYVYEPQPYGYPGYGDVNAALFQIDRSSGQIVTYVARSGFTYDPPSIRISLQRARELAMRESDVASLRKVMLRYVFPSSLAGTKALAYRRQRRARLAYEAVNDNGSAWIDAEDGTILGSVTCAARTQRRLPGESFESLKRRVSVILRRAGMPLETWRTDWIHQGEIPMVELMRTGDVPSFCPFSFAEGGPDGRMVLGICHQVPPQPPIPIRTRAQAIARFRTVFPTKPSDTYEVRFLGGSPAARAPWLNHRQRADIFLVRAGKEIMHAQFDKEAGQLLLYIK